MPSNSLEQEAMDRVARMYSSFDSRQNNRHTEPFQKPHPHKEPENSENHPEHFKPDSNTDNGGENKRDCPPYPPKNQNADSDNKDTHGLLQMLMKDKEQGLILMLLVILSKDGADLNLLFALFYLLM